MAPELPAWKVRRLHLSNLVEMFGQGNGTAEIVSLLERGLENERQRRDEERLAERGTLKQQNPHASDAGSCPRKLFFAYSGEEPTEPLTTDSLINFKVGHAVEEAFAQILTDAGFELHREVHLRLPAGPTEVTGRVDFFATHPELKVLVELKSISSMAMKMMLKNQEPGRDNHRRQLGLYLHASRLLLLSAGDEPLPVMDHGYLVYVVKDASKGAPNIHAFKVPYDEQKARADLRNLGLMWQMAKQGADPGIPAGYDYKRFPCTYCSYRTLCWKDKDAAA